MITTAGKTEMAKIWGNIASDAWAYIALGTGTTAAAVGDTTLETEKYRTAATITIDTILYPEDTLVFRASTTADATYDISEIGILNKATAGDLLCRIVLDSVTSVVSGTVVTSVYKVTFKYGGTQTGSGW